MKEINIITPQLADLKSKIEYLARNAEKMQISLSHDVIELIASQSCNCEALMKMLIFLAAHSRLRGVLITTTMAAELLEDTSIYPGIKK